MKAGGFCRDSSKPIAERLFWTELTCTQGWSKQHTCGCVFFFFVTYLDSYLPVTGLINWKACLIPPGTREHEESADELFHQPFIKHGMNGLTFWKVQSGLNNHFQLSLHSLIHICWWRPALPNASLSRLSNVGGNKNKILFIYDSPIIFHIDKNEQLNLFITPIITFRTDLREIIPEYRKSINRSWTCHISAFTSLLFLLEGVWKFSCICSLNSIKNENEISLISSCFARCWTGIMWASTPLKVSQVPKKITAG